MSTTIAALSTPDAEAAISVIRLSGSSCPTLAREIFGRDSVVPRRANFGEYKTLSGESLDDVVYILYRAPSSYTGEDMLEISCHGNPFICAEILRDLFARGCLPAAHGEFTRRAFLNDKMDLSQAEAVALSIEAKSLRSLEAARKQLSGELGRKIGELSDAVADMSALVEAYIDFPDEDLPAADKKSLAEKAGKVSAEIRRLAETAKYAPILKSGVNIAIAGEPNAGKSSLMNALLGENRAIVSSVAGTTRDVIGERINIGGHLANLSDTAGLRAAQNEIEVEGVERAAEKIADADLKLLVVDASQPPPKFESEIMAHFSPKDTIIVINKCDIDAAEKNFVEFEEIFFGFELARISCKSCTGIGELKDRIKQLLEKNRIVASSDDILVGARHADALLRADKALVSAAEKISRGEPSELAASDLREALEALGEIVGKTDNEAILDRIFSKFCIGK